MEKRYTYDYKGSKTVLDHILLPLGWQDRVSGVTIDDEPDRASDHWPVLDLSWRRTESWKANETTTNHNRSLGAGGVWAECR